MESLGMMRYLSLSSSHSSLLSFSSSFPSSSSPSSLTINNNKINNNNNRKKHNNKVLISSSATLKDEVEEEVEEESVSVTSNNGVGGLLTAKERRELRNERRESKALSFNWREEVEERLLKKKKPKKRYASWTEELNLDNLALLGPQWWVVRVSRASGQDTADSIARSLSRNFPNIDFKIYAPAVRVKRKLKNGTISVKPKPLFPGCVFLRCIMNKEIHDFIRECVGVGGFLGSIVGNTKRQINRPKPVSSHDIEVIFQQAKEEQEKTDQAFEEELRGEAHAYEGELSPNSKDVPKSVTDAKQKRRLKKGSEPLGGNPSPVEDDKFLIPGSSIRVVSGPFMEFTGSLKKLDPKTGKATVGFMLFGKESLVKLDVNQIAVEAS